MIVQKNKVEAEHVFEVSWEVSNKVGGIYSVISSKAQLMNLKYKNYYCIGPYFKEKANIEFNEESIPEEFKEVFDELRKEGVIAHYGKWLVKGEPKTVLLEFSSLKFKIVDLKKDLWMHYGVDSLFSSWEFEEPMLFSYAVYLFVKKLENKNKINCDKTILHCHEWMSGFAALFMKNSKSKISTVFTTHSTVLGRSMSSHNQDFYEQLQSLKVHETAKNLGIIDKHTVERACALYCDVFTTVSEITGKEAEYVLGKKPDVIVMNGLDMNQFPNIEEMSLQHKESKSKLDEFSEYFFGPYYEIEPKNNIYFYLAGRYEFMNKGMDVFIESLKKLNQELKRINSKKNIIVFFFIAMPNNGVKTKLLVSKNSYKHMKNYVLSKSNEFFERTVVDFMNDKDPRTNVFSPEFMSEMKRIVKRFKQEGTPLVITHDIYGEESNSILKSFSENNLNNVESDKVKVIYYPAYLDGSDSLLNLDFYDAVTGCNLGVFPSYYEPWGYTPLESASLGVPAVTTDLTGFGQYLLPSISNFENDIKGIFVLKRQKKNKDEIVDELFKILLNYALLEHEDRVENKIRAKQLANLADWDLLIENYIKAHNLALQNHKKL
ncbi:glycogen/starch synthase [Candidatus Woesearchaeota archaeon]|nr:glycogen/starch synthase [Candidatus Woesearchaeota archaeon]